jgi:hypothetical protein
MPTRVEVGRTPAVASFQGLAVLGAIMLCVGACGGSSSPSPSSPSPSTPTPPPVRYVSVTGSLFVPTVGGTTQLRANANTASGSQDVTSQSTWRSFNDSIATVSSGGLVTAAATGLVVVTATYQNSSGSAGIAVATAVNVTGTWRGTTTNPSSDLEMRLTQSGDSVSGDSTAIGGGSTYTGTVSGTLNGGTLVLGGSNRNPSGNLFTTWSDERCALESATSMNCLNPVTYGGRNVRLTEVTRRR